MMKRRVGFGDGSALSEPQALAIVRKAFVKIALIATPVILIAVFWIAYRLNSGAGDGLGDLAITYGPLAGAVVFELLLAVRYVLPAAKLLAKARRAAEAKAQE